MKRQDPNCDDAQQDFPQNTAATCAARQGSLTSVRSANRIVFGDPAQEGPEQAGPQPDCESARSAARSHLQLTRAPSPDPGLSRCRVDNCAPILQSSKQVTSTSVKPRLAGRQPSTAAGCSG
ncbi:possible Mce family protein [Rhodococcus wratislaviensis]|uniref:Possible Mce family protein n=1 Tax=Rhodococcus wratislaviensis TaxID=44752 RepID=A0A402C6V4_RHOWR|nr:possible Mce family protein [Rhodococcus wratislaviensis]